MTNAEIVHCRNAVQAWREQYGNYCPLCGRSGVKLTADHLAPVSRGGDPLGPVRVICKSC